jgi:HTH-type transcriptional regulator / antitoxin HipB
MVMFIRSPKALALYVKHIRKKRRLSQEDVAKLVGLRQATISEFENNPETTKLETLFNILSAVKLDLEILPKEADTDGWMEEW